MMMILVHPQWCHYAMLLLFAYAFSCVYGRKTMPVEGSVCVSCSATVRHECIAFSSAASLSPFTDGLVDSTQIVVTVSKALELLLLWILKITIRATCFHLCKTNLKKKKWKIPCTKFWLWWGLGLIM